MPSEATPEVGCKQPTLRLFRPYETTQGAYACQLMASLGEVADDAERGVLDDWLAYDDRGKFAHPRAFLSCARQNLKTWSIKARMLFGAAVLGERILYTAHNGDTATEVRELMLGYFGRRKADPKARFPWLNRRIKRVSMRTGHEAIYLENGGCMYFSTRTDDMKLGFTVDVVIFDEAQRLKEQHLSAIVSTASAAPLKNPQYIYCGTPPEVGNTADVFQVKLEEVIDQGGAEGCTVSRWSANDIEGFEPDAAHVSDKSVWYRLNPALGDRINESTVIAELGSYTDPLTFAQQRLCYFLPRNMVIKRVFNVIAWDALQVDKRPDKPDKTAIGIRYKADGSTVTAAFCDVKGETAHVGLIARRNAYEGVDWLVDMAAKHKDDVALFLVDGKNGAADLMQRMTDAGISSKAVKQAGTADVLGAAGMFVAAFNEGKLTHVKDDAVRASIGGAVKRKIGSGYGFGGDDAPEIVEAMALALFAARTTKRDPRRKARVW